MLSTRDVLCMERTSVVLVVVLVVLGNTPQMFKLLYWVFLGGEHGGRVACRHCRIAVTWSTSLVSNSFPSPTGIALFFSYLLSNSPKPPVLNENLQPTRSTPTVP